MTSGSEAPGAQSSRALVVDDEPVICEYLADVLQDMGLDVSCAHDVETALRIAGEDSRIDVAFVDLALPDRSGLELIAELSRARPGLPIVLATTYSAMARADVDNDPAGRLVLGKPYNQESVAAVLRKLNLGANA